MSGADCDIFISAAQKQMNQIDETAADGYEGTNYVEQGTRVDLLQNKCALVVSPSTTKTIKSWSDFEKAIKAAQSASDLTFAMGNSDVPGWSTYLSLQTSALTKLTWFQRVSSLTEQTLRK